MKPPIVFALALAPFLALAAAASNAQDVNAGRNLAAACFTCHGTHGHSVQNTPPSLAGRGSAELFQMMKDFQAGRRPATIMHQQARGYSDAQLKAITQYLASLKPAPARLPAKP